MGESLAKDLQSRRVAIEGRLDSAEAIHELDLKPSRQVHAAEREQPLRIEGHRADNLAAGDVAQQHGIIGIRFLGLVGGPAKDLAGALSRNRDQRRCRTNRH